jgi:hypothetical protein
MERLTFSKKGQLTLFIFMAIVVFALAYYFLFDPFGFNDENLSPQVKPVYDVVEACMQDITQESLITIGASGGYFTLPERVNAHSVPYYFYEGENLMPSLESIESEIEDYVDTMLFFCVTDHKDLWKEVNVSFGETSTSTQIREDDTVTFEVSFPFVVSDNSGVYSFDRVFEKQYDLRLYSYYSLIEGIMLSLLNEPRALCVSCIYELSQSRDLSVRLWDYGPSEVVFFISDESGTYGDSSFLYLFVVKFEEDNNYDPFESLTA